RSGTRETSPYRTRGFRKAMAAKPQLDAAGSSRKGFVIFHLIPVLALGFSAFAQDSASDQARLPAAHIAFDAGHWEQAAKLARGPADQSPDFDFLAGLALAHLEKWDEAKLAFDAGFRKAPGDSRFLVELAGVARSEEHTSELQSRGHLVCRLLLEK